MSFAASGLPDGPRIDMPTGAIMGTLSYASSGTYNLTVTASDGTDLVDPGDPSDAQGGAIDLTIAASDAVGDALNFSTTGLPAGLVLDTGMGVVTGAFSYDVVGVHSMTIKMSDGRDSTNTSFNWDVINANRAPVIIPPDTPSNDTDGVSRFIDRLRRRIDQPVPRPLVTALLVAVLEELADESRIAIRNKVAPAGQESPIHVPYGS